MAHLYFREVQGARDYYKVLEVPHTATPDEIRRAYRSLALQFHPDRNAGSREAEERFKELAEAFHTLSDPDRREAYDVWGPRSAAARGSTLEVDAPDLDDAVAVFVQQFSQLVHEELPETVDFGELGSRTPYLPLRIRVSLGEVATGVTKEVGLPCTSCSGTGVRRNRVAGDDVCLSCGGGRESPSGETVLVDVPPGALAGDCLRVSYEGYGDLLAIIEVAEDPRFVRAGADVILELPVSMRRGLGSEVEVPTPTGSTWVKIPAWTPVGGALRIPGEGLPARSRPGRGDLIVKLIADESEGPWGLATAGGPDGGQWMGSAAATSRPSAAGFASEVARPSASKAAMAGLAFVLGGATVGALSRIGSEVATAGLTGFGLMILLIVAVSAASIFLVSSLLAFLGGAVVSWMDDVRAKLADGRSAMRPAMQTFEGRLRRFAARERRHPARPLVVQLDRLADAVEHAGESQIKTLARLEQRLYEDATQLGIMQGSHGWNSDEVALRLRESARFTADSTAAAPMLLLVAVVLTVIDFWVLRQAMLPVLPQAGGLPFPLSVIEPAGLFATLLAGGALVSGALRQSLEPLVTHPLRVGDRAPERKRHPLLLRLGPTLLVGIIAAIQTICFYTLSSQVAVSARLALLPYGQLAAPLMVSLLPVVGAVLTLVLVSLGFAFWSQVRQAFASDSDGAMARKLRRQAERAAGPGDLQALRTSVAQLATAVEAFSSGITAEFARATGFDSVDQSIVRSVRAAAARVSERGGTFVPRGLRSLEQLTGTLVIGTAGFVLLFALLWLLFNGLTNAFATAAPFAGSVPAPLLGAAATLVFMLGGYVLKDALYGSNHAATLLVTIPQLPGRRIAAGVAGAGLVIGILFVGWLGVAGLPLEGAPTFRSAYLVLLSWGVAAISTNLDDWIVSAHKLCYVALNSLGWVLLAAARALLVAIDWALVLAAEAVGLLSIPGQWVRMKVFRPA